jgi:hypothetical protein
MSRLIPDGFLTIRQAAERLVVAMYSGVPDRAVVQNLRESGLDVADGPPLDDAISEVWAAVDKGKIDLFLVGARGDAPLKFSAEMSKGIPLLRSPRGADFSYLRPANPYQHQFVEWFGRDLSTVTPVFREEEIKRLARGLLRARRRRTKAAGQKKAGRPSRAAETKEIVRRVIDQRRWSPTQSMKALTQEVNRQPNLLSPLSEDSILRALDQLHAESGDRRFERVRRERRRPGAAHS